MGFRKARRDWTARLGLACIHATFRTSIILTSACSSVFKMEKDKPEEASFYKPLSAAGRPNPPTWTTALAWAVLGLIIGSALASVVLDPLNRAGVAKTSFDPARARQQQAPSSEHDQNVPGAAAAAGQLAMDMPLDAARPASRKAWQSWADVDTIFCLYVSALSCFARDILAFVMY